jgi:hypothetical protein
MYTYLKRTKSVYREVDGVAPLWFRLIEFCLYGPSLSWIYWVSCFSILRGVLPDAACLWFAWPCTLGGSYVAWFVANRPFCVVKLVRAMRAARG